MVWRIVFSLPTEQSHCSSGGIRANKDSLNTKALPRSNVTPLHAEFRIRTLTEGQLFLTRRRHWSKRLKTGRMGGWATPLGHVPSPGKQMGTWFG